MIGIISALLPVIIKIMGMWFNSNAASKEQREAFKEFVDKMQKNPNTPAKLKMSYEEQLKKLQEENP